MTNVKISQLPAATLPLDSAVEMPVVQGGVTKRAPADATTSQLSATLAASGGSNLVGFTQTNSSLNTVQDAITQRDGGLVTITTPTGDNRLYVGENIVATNNANTGQYGLRFAAYRKVRNTSGVNDIADTLIGRYDDISGSAAWLRWDVIFSPLNPSSGLPTAPTNAQSFYIVAAEINPQNRHNQGSWQGEPRAFVNPVGGHQMVAETQDFTSLLPAGTRIGYDLAFGYALSKSPFTNSTEQRHARYFNGILGSPNAIAPQGAFIFASGFRDYPTAIVIGSGGTGYTVGDLLTFNTGLSQAANENTVVRVIAVNGSGVITSAEIYNSGWYQQSFASPIGVTGGTGSGATFTYTMANQVAASPRAFLGLAGAWDYGLDGAGWVGTNNNVGGAVFNGSMIRSLNNQEIIRSRNAADNADVSMFMLNASDRAVLMGRQVYLPQTYSPTITAGSGTFTTVTVTSARYSVANGRCYFDVGFQITAVGTGATSIRVTLPINATQPATVHGINSNSGQGLVGLINPGTDATRCILARYDAADPIVDTNFYIVSGCYEVAA